MRKHLSLALAATALLMGSIHAWAQERMAFLIRSNGTASVYMETKDAASTLDLLHRLSIPSNADVVICGDVQLQPSTLRPVIDTLKSNHISRFKVHSSPRGFPGGEQIAWRGPIGEVPDAPKPLKEISVRTAGGSILVNGQATSLEKLGTVLNSFTPPSDYVVQIRCNPVDSHNNLVGILNTVHENHFDNVSVKTEREK